MRDEELALRFFAFHIHGLNSYKTPQKYWLNEAAQEGRDYSDNKIAKLRDTWKHAVRVSLIWFKPEECFRRIPVEKSRAINRALFDLTMHSATAISIDDAKENRTEVRKRYRKLLRNDEFGDLISRAVDHTKRTKRRFEMWDQHVGEIIA